MQDCIAEELQKEFSIHIRVDKAGAWPLAGAGETRPATIVHQVTPHAGTLLAPVAQLSRSPTAAGCNHATHDRPAVQVSPRSLASGPARLPLLTTRGDSRYGYSDDDESARVRRGNVLEPQLNVRSPLTRNH